MKLNMADSLWAWLTEYPDGSYGLIAMVNFPIDGLMAPLIGRSEEAVRTMEPQARAHGKAHNQRVWLRRYDVTMDYPDDNP